jgi:hypothetical protein
MNRKDPLHQLVISDFSKRIDDSKQVTELYKKLLELPVFPNGPTACPADNGVQYELAFVKKDLSDNNCTIGKMTLRSPVFQKRRCQGHFSVIGCISSLTRLIFQEFR